VRVGVGRAVGVGEGLAVAVGEGLAVAVAAGGSEPVRNTRAYTPAPPTTEATAMAAMIEREGSRRMQQIVDEWRLPIQRPFAIVIYLLHRVRHPAPVVITGIRVESNCVARDGREDRCSEV